MDSEPPSKKRVNIPVSCRIGEIVQYECQYKQGENTTLLHCVPISRLFRMCSGKPAVEITKVIDINSEGEIEIPRNFSEILPEGKSWRDIIRKSEET
ncbi:hypothetical protein C8J56DRAFT_916453 [Mycena floridula]|nr:hypothetical protein C8J56DRAFT_916453 [Mycena floridula]